MPVARQTSQASPKYLTIISATPLARYALRLTAPSRVNQKRRRRTTRFAIDGHLFSEVHDTQEACARVKMKGFERGACGLQTGSAKNTETRETEPGAAQAATFVTTYCTADTNSTRRLPNGISATRSTGVRAASFASQAVKLVPGTSLPC